MIAVWESDISATFLIFRLKCSTDAAFFKFLGKLFHNMEHIQKYYIYSEIYSPGNNTLLRSGLFHDLRLGVSASRIKI